MKRCPMCRTPYDPSQSFCTKDGAPLVDEIPTGFDTQPDTLILAGHTPTTQAITGTENKFVCPDKWLHDIAESDKKNLQNAVLVEDCEINYQLSDQVPTIEFTFYIFNGSVYTIIIDSSIKGEVGWRKKPLSGETKMLGTPPKNIPQKSREKFTVCQWVNREEADSISKANWPATDYFYFSNLKIGIRGGDDFSDVQPGQLMLPHSISSHNERDFITNVARQYEETISTLKAEKDSLKSQLEEERANNKQPDISGEITEVHFDKIWNTVLYDGTHSYSDFHFTIRVYMANLGATTTIKEFRFVLTANGRTYKGERESLKGYCIQRQTTRDREPLIDIEDSNDTPLDHTRNGWLRFKVDDVQDAEDESEQEMEIELEVIDKHGTSYKLDTLLPSQWTDDSKGQANKIVNDPNVNY